MSGFLAATYKVMGRLWAAQLLHLLVLGEAFYLQYDPLLVEPLCSVLDRLLFGPILAFLLPEEEDESHHSDASVCMHVCVFVCVSKHFQALQIQ